ncbi:hypothetical protein LEP1GSC126_0075 [Leptospira kirschneri str. 200801774]|uniref:hypothetical protein n=1 Tax=Leptospira kirschneri TaxID=29507 RepID=UPI0002BF177F|nr:hypothetical protein [Leptospira kirschneri]EMO78547.1 hypothetical protein LEP1GSC126_0075 [Leptospira kirschneri str. 200801774]
MNFEVGKYYKIPCAELIGPKGKRIFVPVNGPEHSDPQFGAKENHHHIDTRFISENSNEQFSIQSGFTNKPIWTGEKNIISGERFYFRGIVFKRRLCRSKVTGLLGPSPLDRAPQLEKYKSWAKGFFGKKCQGGKCPHLGTELIEANGVKFCPLHGLKSDKEGSEIVGYFLPEQGVRLI